MAQTKVYFACSIRGGGDTSFYEAIITAIRASNGLCLSEIFINDAIKTQGSPLPDLDIYTRDIAWIHECNVVIAEVTNPSLGVGYELAFAEKLNKPILTLFNRTSGKKLSAMISGNTYFNNSMYETYDDLSKLVGSFLNKYPMSAH